MRHKPERVHGETLSIPNEFYQLHHSVTLTVDVMFVNGLLCLTTLSRKIKLHTVEHVQTQTAAFLSSALNKVIKMYARGGLLSTSY